MIYLAFSIPIAIYMWMGGFHSVINSNVLQFFMAIIFVTVVTVVMVVVAYRVVPAGVNMADYLSGHFPFWALVVLFPMLAALSMSTMAAFTNDTPQAQP